MIITGRLAILSFAADTFCMILAGTLLLPDPGAAVRLADGWVRIDSGRIAEVREGRCPHIADLGGDSCVIMPGFVDAHLHLPQFDSIGADGLPLLEWLDRVVFPAEARWADADYAAAMTGRVVDHLLAFGTTAFAAYATVHHAAALAAIVECEGRGVRALVGQVLMDQQAPAELIRPADQLLRECGQLFGRLPQRQVVSRVAPSINPRFAITCGDRLLRGCGELAGKYRAAIQTHLAETLAESRRVAELHAGLRYTDVYDRAGLLTPRTILAHGIHLDAADHAKIADAGSLIAHCPTANLFLQSGTMNRHAAVAAGVRVALGSDVAGGPDRSMPRVARAMIDAAKRITEHGPPPPHVTDRTGHIHPHHPSCPPTPAAAWHQITAGNADALGWPRAGRITPDAEADVLVLRPDVAWREAFDPLGALLYAWDDRWLRHVIVAGVVR